MPTQVTSLSWYIGEDVVVTDTIFQAGGVLPQNITGWSISFIVHAPATPGTPIITKTVGAGIVLTTPLAGVLTVTILAADTSGLTAGSYVYRIERTDSGADAVLTQGTLLLLAK